LDRVEPDDFREIKKLHDVHATLTILDICDVGLVATQPFSDCRLRKSRGFALLD
jgi:hypothetical protein